MLMRKNGSVITPLHIVYTPSRAKAARGILLINVPFKVTRHLIMQFMLNYYYNMNVVEVIVISE